MMDYLTAGYWQGSPMLLIACSMGTRQKRPILCQDQSFFASPTLNKMALIGRVFQPVRSRCTISRSIVFILATLCLHERGLSRKHGVLKSHRRQFSRLT